MHARVCLLVRVINDFILFLLFIRAPLPASLYANEEDETKTNGEQFGLVKIIMINFSAQEEALN